MKTARPTNPRKNAICVKIISGMPTVGLIKANVSGGYNSTAAIGVVAPEGDKKNILWITTLGQQF